MADRKAKLLKKYMGEVNVKRQAFGREGLQLRDRQEIQLNSSLSSGSQSEQIRRGRRVQDSDEQQIEQPKPKKKAFFQEQKKSKTVSKGLRKALGLKKGEQIDQFISALKVEGVDMKDISSYLKNSKEGLIYQNKKEKKQKKKRHKQQQENQVKKQYYEKNESSSQSDLQIPEQARTIHRDKEGRIKQFSQAKQKEMKIAQVMDRLGEWQKGMKNQQQNQEQQQDNNMWDDPAKRWQTSTAKHPLTCQYQGYANRFNIKPGYRWDGVIRGNGFETTYLQEINMKKVEESRQQRQYLKNL